MIPKIEFNEGESWTVGFRLIGISNVLSLSAVFKGPLENPFQSFLKEFKLSDGTLVQDSNDATVYKFKFDDQFTLGKAGKGTWQIAFKTTALGERKSKPYTYIILKSTNVQPTGTAVVGTAINQLFEVQINTEVEVEDAFLVTLLRARDNYEIAVDEGFVGTRPQWLATFSVPRDEALAAQAAAEASATAAAASATAAAASATEAATKASEAAASATAAANSASTSTTKANEAAASATAAANSASTSTTKANEAAASATAAAASATAAATSATNAANSATAAAASATAAATKASEAAASATAAANSASTSTTKATEAAASATAAAASATAAATSATNAANSATAAAASATAAATSATNAANSATAAAASATTATNKAAEALVSANNAAASAAAASAVALGNSTGFPSVRPTLFLDFANSRNVPPIISFTRNSVATYFDSKGIMQTAKVNAPRIDFDPVTGECLGLLVEESRTNSLANSSLATSNATLSASSFSWGILTFQTLTATSNSQPLINTVTAVQANTTETASIFVRQVTPGSGTRYASMSVYYSGGDVSFVLDLQTGVLTTVGNPSHNGSTASGTVTAYPNSIYRLTMTFTAGANPTFSSMKLAMIAEVASNPLYSANIGSAILVAGAQKEIGAFATSYIPTTSTAVTRSVELTTISGLKLSRWYNANKGTFFVEAKGQNGGTIIGGETGGFQLLSIRNGLYINSWETGSADLYTGNLANSPITTFFRTAIAFQSGVGRRLLANAGTIVTSSSYTVGSILTLLPIASMASGGHSLNGHIKRLYYYPVVLSDSQLQAITAP